MVIYRIDRRIGVVAIHLVSRQLYDGPYDPLTQIVGAIARQIAGARISVTVLAHGFRMNRVRSRVGKQREKIRYPSREAEGQLEFAGSLDTERFRGRVASDDCRRILEVNKHFSKERRRCRVDQAPERIHIVICCYRVAIRPARIRPQVEMIDKAVVRNFPALGARWNELAAFRVSGKPLADIPQHVTSLLAANFVRVQ
jgi:hypothetical protein